MLARQSLYGVMVSLKGLTKMMPKARKEDIKVGQRT